MDEQEKIDECIKELEKSISHLKDQEYMETWVVGEFLLNLNIEFDKNEMKKATIEPLDVIFQNANFQVKTIYDEDRKMLKEYKDRLEKAKKASSFAEASQPIDYDPVSISLQEIANNIEAKLETYILSPEQYRKIDMLFYFNKLHCGIIGDARFSFSNKELWEKWRSVSMVKGGVDFIFWASKDAPDFIEMNTDKIICRNKPIF